MSFKMIMSSGVNFYRRVSFGWSPHLASHSAQQVHFEGLPWGCLKQPVSIWVPAFVGKESAVRLCSPGRQGHDFCVTYFRLVWWYFRLFFFSLSDVRKLLSISPVQRSSSRVNLQQPRGWPECGSGSWSPEEADADGDLICTRPWGLPSLRPYQPFA